MAINERLVHTASAAAAGGDAGNQEEGLILHLDANDVDSYDGDGSVWYDVSTHEVTVPLSDNADDLELHLNASDSTSYGGTGTTWTDIAGSNDGTIDSTVASTYDKDNGGYFDFRGDANSDQVSVPYNSDLDLTSSGITIELWCKPDSTGYEVVYNSTGSASPYNGIQLFFHSGFDYYVYAGGTNIAGKTSGGGTASTSEWGHYVITIEGTASGSNVKTYINGELDHSNTLSAAYTGSTADILLGNYTINSGSYDYDGKLGAVRIYSKELSASEVGQNYRHGRDYTYTELHDTDLELHLDSDSFPEKGESGYSNTPSTWTALTGSNGTITGATFDSELGNFLTLDGSGDYITTAQTFNSSSDFTVELWVRRDTNGERLLYKSGGTHPNAYYLIFQPSLGLYYRDYTMGKITYTGLSAFPINKWVHVCVVNDSNSNPKVYINGVHENASTTGGTNTGTSGTDPFIIGQQFSAAAWYDWSGDIGQVRIHSSVLTQTQIRQNFNFTKNDYPNGYNGTISGATWNPSGYFDFDGSNDFIQIPTNTSYTSATRWSIAMWINPTSIAADEMLATLYGSSSDQKFDIRFNNSSGNIRFIAGTSSGGYNSAQDLASASALSTSTWYHLVCVYDDTNDKMFIYIDGSLDATKTSATNGTYTSITDPILIGKRTDGYHSNVEISDFKFYNKVLTAAEVTAQYNIGYNGIG